MKKLLAMTAAFVLALSMVACGDADDDDDDESKAPKKSASQTVEDESTEPAETEATTTTTEAETEPATTTTEETTTTTTTTTEAEPEPEPAGENDYVGDGYKITVDPAKWTQGSGTANVDVSYNNTGDLTCNFNAVSTASGGATADDLAAMGDQLKAQYEAYGYTVNEIKKDTYNGQSVLFSDIEIESSGFTLRQNQYYFIGGSRVVIFTYTAEKSAFDTYYSDFTAVLDSLQFT